MAAAAFAGGGENGEVGGEKRGTLEVRHWGRTIAFVFGSQNFPGSFMLVWSGFICCVKKMVFDSDVSDLAPEILPR